MYFTTSSDTVSFNGGSPGIFSLGSNNCTAILHGTCSLITTASGTADGTVTLSLSMPNLTVPAFLYSGEPSLIKTLGSPTLSVSLSDTHGDKAQGTFALTNLLPDGVKGAGGFTGVDIDGSITITSVTPGGNAAAFDSLFDLPSPTPLSFTLDVGDCKRASKSVACIAPEDPTASFISLDLDPGTSATPEPGTIEMLGGGIGLILLAARRRRP